MTRYTMHRLLLLAVTTVAPLQRSHGQATAEKALHCYYTGTENRLGSETIGNGRFTLTIEGPPDSSQAVEDACRVRLTGADGRTRYRASGFGARVDAESSGLDVDGDGVGDLVLEIDTGGGNHCCWRLDVISLQPTARRILSFSEQGAARFSRDPTGRVVLRSWEGGFGAERYSMAERVFAERVYRLQRGVLIDVTALMCRSATDSLAIRRDEPPPDEIAVFRRAGSITGSETTASRVEALMLQHVLCREVDRARDVAVRLWPHADRERLLREFPTEVVAAFPFLRGKFGSWSTAGAPSR